MTDPLAEFYVHTVDVATLTGRSGSGDEVYAPSVPVLGFLEGSRHLVRSAGGEQVTSTGTFYAPAATAPLFTAGSRVALPGRLGEPSRVITASTNDLGPDWPEHVEVHLE